MRRVKGNNDWLYVTQLGVKVHVRMRRVKGNNGYLLVTEPICLLWDGRN